MLLSPRPWVASLLLFAVGCASTPPPEPNLANSTIVDQATESTVVDSPKRAVPEGHLRREDVMTVLSEGVPLLLQKVEVEARLDREGHFVGWRVITIHDPLLATSDLQTGDVIRQINGHAIENPYQFFEVFQSLAFAPELHIAILRGAESKDLRYPINDDPSAPPIPPPTIQAPPPQAPTASTTEKQSTPPKKKKVKKHP